MKERIEKVIEEEESGKRPESKYFLIVRRLIVICLAALLMACNIRILVRNAGLVPGGATGLALLIQEAFAAYLNINLPYTLLNVTINAIPVYIGFRYIGKRFTLYSCVMIFLTGIFTDMIPVIKITDDILLSCIFGGLINGTAISLVLSVDATSGGTDFIAIFLSQKKGMDSFNIVLGINAVILSTAGLLFGWDKALYSIIFQYVSTQALHLLYKRYQQQTLFVVTNKADAICKAIWNCANHGATILDGFGSYKHAEREVVYSVVSAAEYERVIRAVKETDPSAFINAIHTDRLQGSFYHKPIN